MTKEELIGRKIIAHSLVTYLLSDGKQDTLTMQVINKDGTLGNIYRDYITIETANNALKPGDDWKLLPIENKMYKTPKGIEYGVGTVFTHQGRSNTIVEIVAEGDKYPIKFLHNNDEKSYMSFNWFCENIDKGNWKIITNKPTMKDYKQVDPKTIKFDFTNTKIKVNNAEEAEWVIRASNNEDTWVNSTYKSAAYYTFSDNGQAGIWASKGATNEETFAQHIDKREITIQDILNNMKEVIEVGDTVIYPAGVCKGDKHVVKELGYGGKDLDTKVTFAQGSWDYKDRVKLLSKGKKKEIIGYETVVDLPGIPKGTKSGVLATDGSALVMGNSVSLRYTKELLQDTKFFKPVYKADDVELKFSKYTATLSKENGLVFTDGEKMPFTVLLQLVKDAQVSYKLGKYAGFEVTGEVELKSIKVGCKSFTAADVKLVSDSIKKLD